MICGQEESELHVHDDSCFQVEQVQNLICGKEEAEASEGHTHSDDCYRSEEVLCGKEEHTHSRECESNKEDVEDPNSWNEAYKEIAKEEDAKKRILTVAKNELNYKENEANFEIDEEGKEHYYTRYGHFYEDKYGDWNNYFTGFVLNYANVQMNFDKDISKWQVKTVNDQNQEVGKEGNVVFFRDDEGELRSGILVEFNELKNDVKIIYGDVDNRVQEVNVNKDKVIAYLDDEVKIEEEDTPLAGGEEEFKNSKSYEDDKISVKVSYNDDADIPEEAELVVKEITEETNVDKYNDVVAKTKEIIDAQSTTEENNPDSSNGSYELEKLDLDNLKDELENSDESDSATEVSGEESVQEEKEIHFVYDISFIVDEVEVEPKTEVKVTIDYKDDTLTKENIKPDDLQIVHIKNDVEPVLLESDIQEAPAAEEAVITAEFITDSFSEYTLTNYNNQNSTKKVNLGTVEESVKYFV